MRGMHVYIECFQCRECSKGSVQGLCNAPSMLTSPHGTSHSLLRLSSSSGGWRGHHLLLSLHSMPRGRYVGEGGQVAPGSESSIGPGLVHVQQAPQQGLLALCTLQIDSLLAPVKQAQREGTVQASRVGLMDQAEMFHAERFVQRCAARRRQL